jgi:hypothetical protein
VERRLSVRLPQLPHLTALTTDENLAPRRVIDTIGLRCDRHVVFEQRTLRVHTLP